MLLLERNRHIGDPDEYDFDNCYTRLHRDAGIMEADLVAAMIKHRGNYSRIAKELGRSRTVVMSAVDRDDEFRALRDDIREAMIDEVEHGVFQSAMEGDPAQQRFVLQTLAKERGFVTREERTGKDGDPIHTKSSIDVTKLDDAMLEQLLAAKLK